MMGEWDSLQIWKTASMAHILISQQKEKVCYKSFFKMLDVCKSRIMYDIYNFVNQICYFVIIPCTRRHTNI